MARELQLQITADTTQAQRQFEQIERTLEDLRQRFIASGDSAEQAEKKVEKFSRSYADGAARQRAKRELDELNKSIQHTDERTEKATVSTDNWRAAIMRYVSAGVVLQAIRNTAEWADNLEDLSAASGINVRALQQWDVIARKNGSTMEAVAKAAQRLGADLQQGDKSVVAGVRNLGFEVEDLLAMQPAERFNAVATAIGGIEDPAKRAALAEDVMKRAGVDLLAVMRELAKNGTEDVPAWSAEWVRAGTVVQSAIDGLIVRLKDLVRLSVLVFPKSMLDGFDAWQTLGQGLGLTGGVALPTPAVMTGRTFGTDISGPAAPDFASIERDLTESTRALITARTRTARVTAETAIVEHELLSRSSANAWAINARGMNFVGAPGWRPFENPQLLSNEIATTGWMPPWAPFAGSVGMNAPGGSSGGGFFGNLLGGIGGSLSSMWQGMSGGNGMAGLFSNLGGGLITGGITSLLGMGISGIGKLFGKLFGPSEASKTQSERAGFLDSFGGFDELKKVADEVGFSLDRMMNTRRVQDFQAEVGKLNDAMRQHAEDAERLPQAMQRYGLTIEDAGQKFKQSEMNKNFKELGEDFRVLIGAGFDFNDVAAKMAPHFGALIEKSIVMGTQVPSELRPIMEKMIEMGVLVDTNGEKFENLSQIPFAESMTQGFDRIVAKIDELIAKLTGPLDQALDAIPRNIDVNVNAHYNPPDIPDFTSPEYVSTGGLVLGHGRVLRFDGGGFVPRGTDTVPAMLTPGEMVLPTKAVSRLMRGDWPSAQGNLTIQVGDVSIGSVRSEQDAERELGRALWTGLKRRGVRLNAA